MKILFNLPALIIANRKMKNFRMQRQFFDDR